MIQGAGIVVVVHGLGHLRAALAAGHAARQDVTAISAGSAGAFAGAGWFHAMIQAGRVEYPDVALTAILDCGDRAGDVLTALGLGITHVVFTGHPDALSRLRSVAGAKDAVIFDVRPPALDRAEVADLEYVLRALPAASAFGY